MRRYLSGFVFLFLSVVSSAPAADLVDRVVAVVNEDIITLSELNEEGSEYFRRISERAPAGELESAMEQARQKVLVGLIDKKITEQKAAQMGITVSDKDIDDAVSGILKQNNLTIEKYRSELAVLGFSEEKYRDTLREQILMSRLVGVEVRSKIVITEDKIREYYNTHYQNSNSKTTAGYRILQMGFSWEEQGTGSPAQTNARPTKEEAYKQAVAAREDVLAGQQGFRELARKYSDLPSSVDGGDIGVFAEEEMAPYMREVISGMQPGSVSQIIETASGYQFFKLLAVEQGEATPYEAVKEEIRDQLYQQELEKLHNEWVEKMREQAYIVKLL